MYLNGKIQVIVKNEFFFSWTIDLVNWTDVVSSVVSKTYDLMIYPFWKVIYD